MLQQCFDASAMLRQAQHDITQADNHFERAPLKYNL